MAHITSKEIGNIGASSRVTLQLNNGSALDSDIFTFTTPSGDTGIFQATVIEAVINPAESKFTFDNKNFAGNLNQDYSKVGGLAIEDPNNIGISHTHIDSDDIAIVLLRGYMRKPND